MYSLNIFYFKEKWQQVAVFNPIIFEEMVECGRAIWLNPIIGCENVCIVNEETGEIIWDACDVDTGIILLND